YPRGLLAVGGGTGALAKPGQEELDFGILGSLFEGGELFRGGEQLAEQAIDTKNLAKKRDPVGLLMKHLIGNPLGGMLAIFMSDRGCDGQIHLLAPSKQDVKREIDRNLRPHGTRFPKNYERSQVQHECACTACTYDDSNHAA